MQTVIVDRKGAVIRLDGKRLRIDAEGEKSIFTPLSQIERLIITTGVTLNSSVLSGLAGVGASMLVLSPRDHHRVAISLGPLGSDSGIRLAQYDAAQDDAFCLRVARRLARMKLAGQRRLLLSLRMRPAAGIRLRQALRILSRQLGEVSNASSVASLMGLEGSSATAYFAALAEVLPPSFHFEGRNRRPPRDPVNAVLSLSYTLLHYEAVRSAHMAGFDPCIGFWHAPEYGRESLACDMIEPLRPRADRFVLSLFTTRVLRPESFGLQQGACLLAKAGRQRFYREWENFAEPVRRALRRGAWRLKHVLRERK